MSTLTVSVGPQHPGAAHFRMIVTLDGDTVVDVQLDPGYVHRGEEKLAEYRTYVQNIPHLERPTILDSAGILYPYVLASEEIIGFKVPERAQYIRVIMAELTRIATHLYWLGIYGIFVGHSTMYMWSFGDRDLFVDLIQMLGGQRITHAYFIPGGVRNDVPDGFKERAIKYMDYFEKRLLEYDRIFFSNPLFLTRVQDVGILSTQDAISLGVVGPTLRGSNVRSDTRIDEPYDVYGQIDFEVPVYKGGDSYSRSMVRFEEMKQSMRIVRQCLARMPEGPVRVLPRGVIRGPPGEAYARTEAGRGQFSYYLVSDGGPRPYRLKISSASFRNMVAIPVIARGGRLADLPVVFWSLDYWPVEADR